MEIAVYIVGFLVIAGFSGYFYLMIRHPEWVGITGDSAKKTMAEHQEGSKVDDSDPFTNVPRNK